MDRDDVPSNRRVGVAPTIGDVIAERYSRRSAIKGLLGAGVIAGLSPAVTGCTTAGERRPASGAVRFTELERGVDATHHVAPGYDADILIRWGDPLFPGTGAFDPRRQSASDQARRFGYNNDFVGFVPLPARARGE